MSGSVIVAAFHDVRVKIPKIGGLNTVEAQVLPGGEKIPRHFHNCVPVKNEGGKTLLLNRHYYGIDLGDVGREVSATVEVWNKKLQDGRVFSFINLRKQGVADRATAVLKLISSAEMGDGDVLLTGFNMAARVSQND